MRRNIAMLHSGHVSGLEKPGDVRCEFADTVFDSDVHDSGNAKMVYLEGKNKNGTKISSMAAWQESGYNRGIEYHRENAPRVSRDGTD